ncbi:MAG: winged helix-turn-helix transcriptional regulator [Spirochaetota bacterium]|nr:winged helix-turn-helix transcriptional regulator [Spirochaetota bacterium]
MKENGLEVKRSRKRSIDKIDSKMIRLLQKNGRLSNTDIAKKLGIAEATVRTRLKRLMDEEYIQIVAVSNPFKLGFEMAGDLYIHVEMRKIERVIKELMKIKELWYIVMTTGDANINAEFVVKTREELNDLVYNKLSRIDGIIRIESSVIMNFAKRKYDFGTALDYE